MPFFYHATLTVHGILWYHGVARTLSGTKTSPKLYAHTFPPVIHNYGLTLELAGFVVDPDVGYVSLFNRPRYKPPLELYKRYGVYAYPAGVIKGILSELTMSAIGESLVDVKKEGRLAYPDLARNTVLMPGSILETLIISKNKLPSTMILRIGSKRYGVLHTKLYPVKPEVIDFCQPSHPYNLLDTEHVESPAVILKHEAGDIAYLGTGTCFRYSVRYGSRKKTVTVPLLRGIEE